jgi:hypothetical protein
MPDATDKSFLVLFFKKELLPYLPFTVCFLAGTLAACHLIDQRDFDPHAGEKPKPPAAKPLPPGPGALLTIKYGAGEPAYATSLQQAVQRALTLKPNVLFTVQTVVPAADSPEAQEQALRDASATGREIAEAIIADGADAGQVEQTVRAEGGVHAKEVRVFVH